MSFYFILFFFKFCFSLVKKPPLPRLPPPLPRLPPPLPRLPPLPPLLLLMFRICGILATGNCASQFQSVAGIVHVEVDDHRPIDGA